MVKLKRSNESRESVLTYVEATGKQWSKNTRQGEAVQGRQGMGLGIANCVVRG